MNSESNSIIQFEFDRIPPAHRTALIKGYGQIIRQLWDSGDFELYLVVIMFNFISRRHGPVLEQMMKETEHFHRTVLFKTERRPGLKSRTDNCSILLGHPDLPVRKTQKYSLADVSINDGLHINAILARPIDCRFPVPIDEDLHKFPEQYYGTSGLKRRIHIEQIHRTPEKATEYVMKFLGRAQFGIEHPFIFR